MQTESSKSEAGNTPWIWFIDFTIQHGRCPAIAPWVALVWNTGARLYRLCNNWIGVVVAFV